MINEPVAWMTTIYRDDNLLGRVKIPQFHQTKPPPHFYDDIQSLYTHPAKTLTDEEIMDAYADHCKTEPSGKGNLIDFARAILRKAQSK